jgi:polyhydroxyalkanoate synthesis regulator protein
MKRYKKFPNRRLYDREKSCYCTLPDIVKAIRTGDTIEVERHKGGDITCEVLLDALKVAELEAPKLTAEADRRSAAQDAARMSPLSTDEVSRRYTRYPSRRLYDREFHRYSTLNDLVNRIIEGDTVGVTDSRTSEDVTHSVLFEALRHMEEYRMACHEAPLLSVARLHEMLQTQPMRMPRSMGYRRWQAAIHE